MLIRARKAKICNIPEVTCAAPPMGSIEGVTHLPQESCLFCKIPEVVCVTPFIGSKIIELSYYIKCAMEWRLCVSHFLLCARKWSFEVNFLNLVLSPLQPSEGNE